jgi:PhzF family phenazine biosynthesis protein
VTGLPLFQVDAFADRPFTGNPAAVMPLDAWLDDATLQAIAAENNLSETAFTVPTGDADSDYDLRWFTPTSEVAMCGHATLASGHVLLRPEQARIRFRTRRAGLLEVARSGAAYQLSLPAWRPAPRPLPDIIAALGVAPDLVVETLWHENHYGLVVLADEAAVRACAPDFRALAAPGDWLTIVTTRGETADIVSRAFAPGAGIDEDPVTGSAYAVAVPYWAEKLGRTEFTAYQASRRGGHLTCRLDGERVLLTGHCVTVIEGRFVLAR